MQNNDDKKQTGRLADNKASMRFRWFRSVAKKSADRLCVCLSAGSTRLGEGTERLLLLSVRVAWRASVRSAVSPVSRDSPRRNIQRGKFEAVHTRGTSWQPRLGAIVVDGWRFCFFHGSSIRRQKKKVPTKNKRRTKKKKKETEPERCITHTWPSSINTKVVAASARVTAVPRRDALFNETEAPRTK